MKIWDQTHRPRLGMPTCAACCDEVARDGFTSNQLRKPLDQRRCKPCVDASRPVAVAPPIVDELCVEFCRAATVPAPEAKPKASRANPATKHLKERQEDLLDKSVN